MMSPPAPGLLRKNGRLPACEPCRKRKLACDHGRPTCRKCERGNRSEACKYIVKDWSRVGQISASTSSTNPLQDQRATHVPSTTSALPPAPPSTNVFRPESSISVEGFRTSPRTSAPESGSVSIGHGYLGFTSFSGIYGEAHDSLSFHPENSENNVLNQMKAIETPDSADRSPHMAGKSFDTCLAVMRSIPEEGKAKSLFDSASSLHDNWIPLVAGQTLKSLYETYGRYLGTRRNDAHLADLARTICDNTAKPFVNDDPDPVRWISQFSGHNLRWETLGILFIYWNRGAECMSAGSVDYKAKSATIQMEDLFRQCMSSCLELGKAVSKHVNLLSLYISYKRMVNESIFAGDASLSCWQYHAETVALMTFLGLHTESSSKPYTPSLASELRRRLCTYIFNIDKVVATFTGRPSLISRKYTTTPVPLDLKDEVLLSDDATLRQAVRALDENGNNPDGDLYATTTLRARNKILKIRDELLEIALMAGETSSIGNLLDIKAREIQSITEVPKVLVLDPMDIKNATLASTTLYLRMILRLEHLQNLFFALRLLHRHGYNDDGELLAVSFEMLSITLLFWTDKDRFDVIDREMQWLVMAYAAPSGGILCLELLRPTILGSHNGNPDMTRSSLVQQLSLLVGFLKWIRPNGPNGQLCASCLKIIQRVLDQTLNISLNGSVALEEMDWGSAAYPEFDFDLLDTFDWMRRDFLAV